MTATPDLRPLRDLVSEWYADSARYSERAILRRMNGMVESAALFRQKATAFSDCANQLREALRALGEDVSQPTPEDQKDHAPAPTTAAPQTPAKTHNATSSNASHKAALELFHDCLEADTRAPREAPHDSPQPSSGDSTKTSPPRASQPAIPPSPPSPDKTEPTPPQNPTPFASPTQSEDEAQPSQPQPSRGQGNASGEIPPQTKAQAHTNSSPEPTAAPASASSLPALNSQPSTLN